MLQEYKVNYIKIKIVQINRNDKLDLIILADITLD